MSRPKPNCEESDAASTMSSRADTEEVFDVEEELGTPPHRPDISRDHPSNRPKPGWRPPEK